MASCNNQDRTCLIHCITSATNDELKSFTVASQDSTKAIIPKWKKLNEKWTEVACSIPHDILEADLEILNQSYGFHQKCYNTFVNNAKLNAAERRVQKRKLEEASVPVPCKIQRTLRSAEPEHPQTLGRGRVLPELCVICGKKDRTYSKHGQTKHDKLRRAQTADAGKLRQAAQNDPSERGERILRYIQDHHCGVLEAQYHALEYLSYTNKFFPAEEKEEKTVNQHRQAFDDFCRDYIEPELIQGRKACKLVTLNRHFNALLKVRGHTSGYRSTLLKKRLKQKYAKLVFAPARNKKHSEHVFLQPESAAKLPLAFMISESEDSEMTTSTESDCRDTPVKTGADNNDPVFAEPSTSARLPSSSSRLPLPSRRLLLSSSTSGSNSDTESEISAVIPSNSIDNHEVLATAVTTEIDEESAPSDLREKPNADDSATSLTVLFNAAMMVRAELLDSKRLNQSKTSWPPLAPDFDIKEAEKIVPIALYNMIAWIVGLSDEPTLTSYAALSGNDKNSHHLRLLSIIQDLLRLESDRSFIPKAVGLALTVKHWTGCTRLIELLNRLGHCVSNATISRLETALAQLQLDRKDKSLYGLTKRVHTIMVYDNIDFKEETLTGRGQSHFTNSIAIQFEDDIDDKTDVESESETEDVTQTKISKRNRKLTAPSAPLETYEPKTRQGPTSFQNRKDNFPAKSEYKPNRDDILYELMKSVNANDSVDLPGWTGFNTLLNRDQKILKSIITYMPVVDGNPTEMDTILTILKRSVEMADKLELEDITLVFDLAIYAKIQEIRWRHPTYRKRSVVRLGEFHQVMSFLGIVGKRYRDAGLETLFIESGIVSQGSINGVISGHLYNRSVRSHKIMAEAMARLRFQSFLDTLEPGEREQTETLVYQLNEVFPSSAFAKKIKTLEIDNLVEKFSQFLEEQCKSSQTFCLWNSYVEMVEMMQDLIRATRTSNWNLHLDVTRASLGWYHAYDHQNYGRYLPAYWLEMRDLSRTNPRIHSKFVAGMWTINRHRKYPFAGTACDQGIEQTINRDSKTSGGFKAFSMNRNAVKRWILAQPERAAITRKVEEMAGINVDTRSRKDLDNTSMLKYETQVLQVVETITQFKNPFSCGYVDLVNITSGIIATPECANDLLTAYERGEKAVKEFLDERLFGSNLSFYDSIPKMKLSTFTAKKMKKTKSTKQILTDRMIFSRLLLAAGGMESVQLRDVLCYSLGPISFPLAAADGGIATTPKAKLRHHITDKWPGTIVHTVPDGGAMIIDGMGVIQSMRPGDLPTTFGQLAHHIIEIIIGPKGIAKNQQRIDLVFDTYRANSIKNTTRNRRAGNIAAQQRKILGANSELPKQWTNFLLGSENKNNLIRFIVQDWQENLDSKILGSRQLFVAYDNICYEFQSRQGKVENELIPRLRSDHEEADTRLFLHCKDAAETHETVTIRSADTDVFVLFLNRASSFGAKLYQVLPGAKKEIVDISALAGKMGAEICAALVGFHTLTGCDSVSCFIGKGKVKPFDLMVSRKDFLAAMAKIGEKFNLDESVIPVIEEFVCCVYGQTTCKSVNEARYKLFITRSFGESKLPPTKNALVLHLKRANYQAAIHRRCLLNDIAAPNAENHGWKVSEDGGLDILWMSQSEAPESLMKQTKCGCKKAKCENKKCSCVSSGLSCSDLCACTDCKNQEATEKERDMSNDVSDFDDDSDDEVEY